MIHLVENLLGDFTGLRFKSEANPECPVPQAPPKLHSGCLGATLNASVLWVLQLEMDE